MLDDSRVRRAGRPKAEEAEQLKQRIVEVAFNEFLESGFAEATFERIAQKAATTRRSISHRFDSKEELLIEAARQHIDGFLHSIIDLPADVVEPLERMRIFCRQMLSAAVDRRTVLFKASLEHEVKRCPELGEMAIAMNEAVLHHLIEIILDAQKLGQFPRYGARALANTAVGMMLSNPINRAVLGDRNFQDEREIDLYFSDMWSIIIAMM